MITIKEIIEKQKVEKCMIKRLYDKEGKVYHYFVNGITADALEKKFPQGYEAYDIVVEDGIIKEDAFNRCCTGLLYAEVYGVETMISVMNRNMCYTFEQIDDGYKIVEFEIDEDDVDGGTFNEVEVSDENLKTYLIDELIKDINNGIEVCHVYNIGKEEADIVLKLSNSLDELKASEYYS